MVDSTRNFTSTDIFATGGEMYQIDATGSVDLAVPDTYKTDPNGTIVTAPRSGTGAYSFFQGSTLPIGEAPVVGKRKLVARENWLPFAPHGALLAGYELSYEDLEQKRYPTLYKVVGASTTAPPSPGNGGPLRFVVNTGLPYAPTGGYQISVLLENQATVNSNMPANVILPLPESIGIPVEIYASGTVDMAPSLGSYEVGPDGVITKAPAIGTGAYSAFRDFAGPLGVPPAVGQKKIVLPRHPRQMAPYGALVAGWSKTANPTTYDDFPDGFEFVGSSGTVTAPEGGGFLFLAVNDFFISNGTDNAGTYSATVKLIENVPSINAAIMLTGFGGGATITSGGFVEIYGVNLSDETRTWSGDDFVDGVAPTSLANVKVLMDGKPAFVYFVSPNQVNCIAPDGLAAGEVDVTVMKGDATSAAFRAPVAERAPALLAPPAFRSGEQQLAVGILPDGFYAGPEGLIAGAAFRPAVAGDRVVFYGIGFGLGEPNVPAGTIAQTGTALPNVEVKFGDTPATVEYAGLTPGLVGLYQLNIVVPDGVTGLVRLAVTIDGVPVEQELWALVQ